LRAVEYLVGGMSQPTSQPDDTRLHDLIEAVQRGDRCAEERLLSHVYERLLTLTRRMFRGRERLARWEQTDDVLQNAMLRLHSALKTTEIASTKHFMNLATKQIRRELIDLGRKHYGPHGVARNHHTDRQASDDVGGVLHATTEEPEEVEEWTAFHQRVGGLPACEREVVDLLYYQGLSQTEAASLLECSVRTVRRRWNDAKLRLCGELADGSASS
jgi:RNA polymerase sigma factor (sigma-70 family)